MKKRLLSALLTFCMVLTMLPTAALAAEDPGGPLTEVKTDGSNGVNIAKTVSGAGTILDPYKLTMDAYVTGSVSSDTVVPLDIVLVIDQSGSMAYDDDGDSTNRPNDRRITKLKTALNGFVSNIAANAQQNKVDHRIAIVGYASNSGGGTSSGISGLGTTTGSSSGAWINTGLYIGGTMKNYITEGTDDSYERVYRDDLNTSETYYIEEGWDYRSVTYDSSREQWGYYTYTWGGLRWNQVTPKSSWNDRYGTQFFQLIPGTPASALTPEDYQAGLVSANTQTDPTGSTQVNSNLTTAINDSMQVNGGTYTEYGLEMAKGVFANNAADGRKRVVVLFTDGETNSDTNTVLSKSNDLKSDYNATVYCVGFGDDVDSNFLSHVSSNYGSDTAYNWRNGYSGTYQGTDKYSMSASNQGELDNIFQTIAGDVSSSVEVGATSVLTDTLSQYFSFGDSVVVGGDGSVMHGVTVYRIPATGSDENACGWGDPVDITNQVNVSVSGKNIQVTGFDYSSDENCVVYNGQQNSWQGYKLRVVFDIQPDVNCPNWGVSGNYDTNSTAEGSEAGLKYGENNEDSTSLTDSPEAPVTTYSVTYDKNASEATGTVTDTKYYITGGEATVLGNGFTWTGHEFTGWNTAANGTGTAYKAGDTITIENANVILYAQWKSSVANYRVEYYQQNLENDDYTIVEDDTLTPSGTVGETATAEIKEYEGFTFNEEKSNQAGTITADGKLVLKMYYDWARYTVRYEYEGTVPENAPELPEPQAYKHGTEVAVATEYSLDGYDFHGWYSDQPDVNGDLQDGTIKVPQYDVVIKGEFTAQGEETYTVTYDLNGGTIQQTGTTYIPLEYRGLHYGDDTPVIPDPTKVSDGYVYEFIGWEPKVSEKVTGNVTYVAQYEKTGEQTAYTVTYLLDDEQYGSIEQYRENEEVTVREEASGATPWATDDLTEENPIIGGIFYMPANNVVFTATTEDEPVTPPDDDCTYSVTSHYIDRDGNEIASVPETGRQPGTAGTLVTNLYSITNDTLSDGREFVYDRATLNREPITGSETLDEGYNEIDVYYDIDELGPDDGPDEVPDKDQIVFTYQTADTEMGVLKEMLYSWDEETNTNVPIGEVSVAEIVIVVTKETSGVYAGSAYAPSMPAYANEGYEFDQWKNDAGDEAELPGYYNEDTTFTAFFQDPDDPGEPEEPLGPITVYFEAVNGTFGNGITDYTVSVMPDEDGDYYLDAGDILAASPYNVQDSTASWTFNGSSCEPPKEGTQVFKNNDTFVVTFSGDEEPEPETVTVSYEWLDPAPAIGTPSADTLDAGSAYYVKYPNEQVTDLVGNWKFLGWYYDEAGEQPCDDSLITVDTDTTLYGEWEFLGKIEEPEPGDGRFMVIKEPDQTSVTVGDPITWTITIASMTDERLTLNVTDTLEDVTLTDADGNAVTNPVVVDGWTYVTLYASYQTTLDDVNREIVNTVVVTDTENPDDTVEEEAPPVEVEPYAITITPANIMVYTGGVPYGGIVDANGDTIEETSGLPEPGYHLELPEAVTQWLQEHANISGAADLSKYLTFTYDGSDGQGGTTTRSWALTYVGIYDTNSGTQEPTRYVYSLEPAKVGDDEILVRILYFVDANNNGKYDVGETIREDDDFLMDADTVTNTYAMTINPGELDQSKIQAVFSVNGETLTCNVEIGTGELTVKSTTNGEYTNGIGTVDSSLISAVADESVAYYVNDSEVTVDADRVQLLVDSVSNSTEFNQSMEQDAINKADAQDGVSLSDAQAESFYLDLVDTRNGNAVVTLGDDDKLTIYWPMPSDADENGEFYIVHYDEMDRTQVSSLQSDPEIIEVTRDGDHLVFQVVSFSPFVLVYEEDDGGSHSGGGGGGSSNDDDDDDDDKPELNKEDHIAYVSGYPDGTVQPEGYITREEVATIFFRLLTDSSRADFITEYNPYPDVEYGRWSYYAITTMTNGDLMLGRPGGVFDPGANITRAEFAVVASLFSNAQYSGPDQFTDISDHWARDYINRAAAEGWVAGYPDGTFGPDRFITRAEVMALVNEVLERAPDADYMLEDMTVWPDNPESAWYYEDVQEATNSHAYVWRNSQHTSEDWEDFIPMRTFDELVRDAFLGR